MAMTVDVPFLVRPRRSPACLRSRHLDRVGLPRPPPDGDRRWKCRRPVSPPSRPSRGPQSTPRSARLLGLPRFPAAAPARLSSSKRASAASMSASSNSSQRLIRSPSTVRMSTPRHSASKPSCEVAYAARVKSAPRSLSRCTASMRMLLQRGVLQRVPEVCRQIDPPRLVRDAGGRCSPSPASSPGVRAG